MSTTDLWPASVDDLGGGVAWADQVRTGRVRPDTTLCRFPQAATPAAHWACEAALGTAAAA